MDDNDTFQHAMLEPGAPKKRKPIRETINSGFETTMKGKSIKGKNKSTTKSPPNSPPPHSTPIKNRSNSSIRDEELRNQRGTSVSEIYQNLSDDDNFNSNLNQSFASTSGSSSSCSKSYNQTNSNNSSRSNQSSREITRTFNESITIESKRSFTFAKIAEPCLNNSGNKTQNKKEGNSLIVSCLGVLAAGVLVAIFIFYCISWLKSNETENSFNEAEFRSKINDLKRLFPSQNKEIWGHFGSGIADVRSGEHAPAIFLLLAGHKETANCLAKKVAELASYALNGTGDVMLTPEKLESDIGAVLNFMERRMIQTKAVVVTDVLSIQPEALKAFHDVCDEYSRLVPKAVYLFTMSSGVEKEAKNLESLAVEQLKNKFSDSIIEDTLKALIVRITTGAVLAVKKEKRIPCYDYE